MAKWRPEGIHNVYNGNHSIIFEETISAVLESLRNQPNSWDLNSAGLQNFIKQVPKPKGRLVFILDDE